MPSGCWASTSAIAVRGKGVLIKLRPNILGVRSSVFREEWRSLLRVFVGTNDKSIMHKVGALRLLSQKYHRLGSLSSNHLCLTFLKARQVQGQDIGRCGAWGGSTSRFTDGCLLSVSSCGRKGRGREREMSLWS